MVSRTCFFKDYLVLYASFNRLFVRPMLSGYIHTVESVAISTALSPYYVIISSYDVVSELLGVISCLYQVN